MNWKYVMAAACVIGALLAGGCGKPSVHVMTVKIASAVGAKEDRELEVLAGILAQDILK